LDDTIMRDRDVNGVSTDGPDGRGLEERVYVLQDANFNVTAVVNTSGTVVERYIYDAYGAVTILDAGWNTLGGSAHDWRYLHQGGRFDFTTGLYHFRNRDLSPTLGRWIQRDPIEYNGGDTNLYRYVGNGPTSAVDPSGLADQPSGWDRFWAGVRTTVTTANVGVLLYRAYSNPDSIVRDLDTLTGGRFSPSAAARPNDSYSRFVRSATSEPGFGESIIPIYGSVRNMMYHVDQGNWGWAAVHAGLAITDAFLVRSIITGVGRVGWRAFSSPGVITGAIGRGAPPSYIHAGWSARGLGTAGWWAYEARGLGAYTVRVGHSPGLWSFLVSPALSARLAMITGQPAWSCVTAMINAWSRANFHLPYLLGSRLIGQTLNQ
jgi:RHS repeat-associated protein